MATKNIEINIKNSTNTYDQLYPKTNSSNIIMSGGENLDEYISSSRQYKVGDTLTTARPSTDFNNEWMVCDGSEVPTNYLISELGILDIKNSKYNTGISNVVNKNTGLNDIYNIAEIKNNMAFLYDDNFLYYSFDLKVWNSYEFDINVIYFGYDETLMNFVAITTSAAYIVDNFEEQVTVQLLNNFEGGTLYDNRMVGCKSMYFTISSTSSATICYTTDLKNIQTYEFSDTEGIDSRGYFTQIIELGDYLYLLYSSAAQSSGYTPCVIRYSKNDNTFFKIIVDTSLNNNIGYMYAINNNLYVTNGSAALYKLNGISLARIYPTNYCRYCFEFGNYIIGLMKETVFIGTDIISLEKWFDLQETSDTSYDYFFGTLQDGITYFGTFLYDSSSKYTEVVYDKLVYNLPNVTTNPDGLTTMIKVN